MKIEVAKSKDLTYTSRGGSRGSSMYAEIFEALKALEGGEAVIVPFPEGVTNRTGHNRLNSALRRAGPDAPEGHRWVKRTTTDGRLAIAAEPIPGYLPPKPVAAKKAPAKPKAKAPAVKKKVKKKVTKKAPVKPKPKAKAPAAKKKALRKKGTVAKKGAK